MFRLTLPIACLLVAGAASAQTFYQTKPGREFVFACTTPEDMTALYEAAVAARDNPDLEDGARKLGDRLFRTRLCVQMRHTAVFERWDSDEDYPELVGVRDTVRTFGGLLSSRGRTYWTRLGWLELYR